MEEQEQVKSKWFYGKRVQVIKITLELTGNEKEFIHRVRLHTDLGDITYKPRKTIESSGDLAGFSTSYRETALQTVGDFITENPMIKLLSDNCKKTEQEVTMSYAEISRFDEQENKELFYKYMRPSQFETIYYKEFHKDDKSNIEKQSAKMKKYSVGEV